MSNSSTAGVLKRGKLILSDYPIVRNGLIILSGALVLSILIWQGIVAAGNPNPTTNGISPSAGLIYTAVLVFREGLECILVLSAILAGLVRTQKVYWKPIAWGGAGGIAASAVTWFVFIAILAMVSNTVSQFQIQAITGLLAVVVLLVVMNWFFHRIYWTGWISFHNKKKKEYINTAETAEAKGNEKTKRLAFGGLMLLGFTTVYREGFEVVIFLQNIRLQIGNAQVYLGCALATILLLITGYFTFIAHKKLPYKRMLILTGVTLAFVFVVIVGEQVQEMQQAGWIPTHTFNVEFPGWVNLWFASFNNWETVIAQALGLLIVVGSYFVAQWMKKPKKRSTRRTAKVKA
jgi:high-affinity iron transporter